jgi:hypothetical protein
MTLLELVFENRDRIRQLAAEHGARNLRVFGSVARGDDDLESDIDFFADFDIDRSLLDRVGLVLDIQDLLGRRVQVISSRSVKQDAHKRILEEALPL